MRLKIQGQPAANVPSAAQARKVSAADGLIAIPDIIPGLDGLRAFSILIVMISHSALANIVPGVFGVTVFFFVSGFLITTLMLAEHRRTGTIAIRPFYIRRLLRLYPPLVASIAATVAVYAIMGKSINPLGIAGALAYLANYLAIFRPDWMQYLGGQLWSLAVEEHFYFVYPLLMVWLLPNQLRTFRVLASICVVSLAVRFYVCEFHAAIAVEYTGKATETRIDSILYGAIAALLWWSAPARAVFERHWKALTAIGLAMLLLSFLWRNPLMRETVRYSIQGIALIPVVLTVTVAGHLPQATALLESRPARWVGRLSYSLYLWHLLGFETAGYLVATFGGGNTVAVYALGWVLAFGVSMLSYRFVETPFFALRKRFGSNVTRVDAVEPASGTAAAVRQGRH